MGALLRRSYQMTEVDEQHRMHLSKGLDEERVLKSQHSMLHHEAEELAQHASGSGAAAATMALIMEDSDGEAGLCPPPPSLLHVAVRSTVSHCLSADLMAVWLAKPTWPLLADPPSCLRTNLLTRCIWNVLSVLVGWFKVRPCPPAPVFSPTWR